MNPDSTINASGSLPQPAETIHHETKRAFAAIQLQEILGVIVGTSQRPVGAAHWISGVRSEHKQGSCAGFISPLSAPPSFVDRESALRYAARCIIRHNENIVSDRASNVSDSQRAEAREIIAWATSLMSDSPRHVAPQAEMKF